MLRTPTVQQLAIVEEVYGAFAERYYPGCMAKISELAYQCGVRYEMVLLTSGMLTPSWNETALRLGLIRTISQQRIGDFFGSEGSFMMLASTGGADLRWGIALLAFTVGRMGIDDVMSLATDDARMQQARYCEAERLLTDRDFPGALAAFERIPKIPSATPELRFAEARASWLRSRE